MPISRCSTGCDAVGGGKADNDVSESCAGWWRHTTKPFVRLHWAPAAVFDVNKATPLYRLRSSLDNLSAVSSIKYLNSVLALK